jgi:hypothetical protein
VRGEAGELKSQVQVVMLVGTGKLLAESIEGQGNLRSISGWELLKGILRYGCFL